MPYPSFKFDGAKFLESRKSLFRFLHVYSHIDPVTIYMYHSRLMLVYDIVSLVTVSLLNVLVTIIRFVLEPIGFASVTAPIHLSLYCSKYNSSRKRD